MPEPFVRRADWATEQSTICDIRRRVFIEEQRVPEALEWDGLDAGAMHVLGGPDQTGAACATGRLLGSGQIGRMAVLSGYRGRGLGSLVLAALVRAAGDSGLEQVFLHAQTSALPFYRGHGFTADGPPFMEAGIQHQLMRRQIVQKGD